ncbi:MAG: peptide-methionine (S)-S-oxide reductase MsrA [Rubrivivax sp.]
MGLLLAAPALPWLLPAGRAADAAVRIPPPAKDLPPPSAQGLQKAVFAGGCFWGVQGVFQHVKGVQRAVSGYAGGTAPTAAYELVSTGRTGHAEAVEVSFDPAQVSYGALLQIFFSVAHDPTQLDRQGPDVGPQYRSAIFPAGPDQLQVAQAYVAQLDAARVFGKPIVTRLEAGRGFFPAEAYHQDFMTEHPQHPYIVMHDRPKLDELKRLFPERFRSEPVLVKPRG